MLCQRLAPNPLFFYYHLNQNTTNAIYIDNDILLCLVPGLVFSFIILRCKQILFWCCNFIKHQILNQKYQSCKSCLYLLQTYARSYRVYIAISGYGEHFQQLWRNYMTLQGNQLELSFNSMVLRQLLFVLKVLNCLKFVYYFL